MAAAWEQSSANTLGIRNGDIRAIRIFRGSNLGEVGKKLEDTENQSEDGGAPHRVSKTFIITLITLSRGGSHQNITPGVETVTFNDFLHNIFYP